jgi:hypothetical protein
MKYALMRDSQCLPPGAALKNAKISIHQIPASNHWQVNSYKLSLQQLKADT